MTKEELKRVLRATEERDRRHRERRFRPTFPLHDIPGDLPYRRWER